MRCTSPKPRLDESPLRRWRRRLVKGLLGTLGAVALLATIEGLISFAIVARSIANKTSPILRASRQKMTRFDAELGWSPTPGHRDPDALGPGRATSIGAQGFRGMRPVTPQVEPGRLRVVIAGDSFAFGTGVADEETWARGLERVEPKLETVNLAVGGYGCDQAFLRYRRDGAALEHQIVLFCFITEDLRRMVVPPEWGAEKPHLVVRDGVLAVAGVPVKQVDPTLRFLRQAGTFVQELRLVQLLDRAIGSAAPRPALSQDGALRELSRALFAELATLAKTRGAHLVVLHLPVESERGGGSIDTLAPELAQHVRAQGGDWIDLLDEFRGLNESDHAALFLRAPEYGAGHYNVSGCARVADWVHARLSALPVPSTHLADGR